MPTVNEGPEEILTSIEKHTLKLGPEQLQDTCLNNVQEVAADSNNPDGDMVKTVPYSIAIPQTIVDEGSERFTPVTEKSPTPVPATNTPGPAGNEEILIPSRPSSAAPPRLRSAGQSKSPAEQIVTLKSAPEKGETVNLLNLYTARSSRHQQPLSFKDLTAEFDRMLKPLSQQMAGYNSSTGLDDSYYYDTSGDCSHPVLAIEPRNPATPPKSFKIHKQRTVIKPGYTYREPVLFDLPINPDITDNGIDKILEIAENMRALPPRVDNYTHIPPSRHLLKPCYYCPRPFKPVQKRSPISSNFGGHSKCSSSGIKM